MYSVEIAHFKFLYLTTNYNIEWQLLFFTGIQADQRVLRTLVTNYLPDIDHVLVQHDIELSLISLHWFLTLFASVVHMKILLRIWDMFLFDGSIVLFQITLGMLKIKGTVSYDEARAVLQNPF